MCGAANSRDGSYGITHLWTDHKDLFLDPDKAMLILRETIGDPNCRVIVSLKQWQALSHRKEREICIKRLVLHNQKTRSYCVLRLASDGRSWQVVSFNRAPDSYGVKQWALK